MNIQEQLDTADKHITSGDYVAAISTYNELLVKKPDCDEAWLMLGSLYGESGEIVKATEHIEKAISINPDNGDAYLILGQIKNSLGDHAAASLAFDKALECDPKDVHILCTRASLYQQQGVLGEAIKLYEKAVELDDSLVEAWAMLGPLHFENNDFEASEKCFQKALSFQSTNPTSFKGYCELLNYVNRSAEVLQLLDNLPEDAKSNHEVLYLMSSAYTNEGLNSKALECIDKAISLNSREKYILTKAEILHTNGDYEQAFDILKPYLMSEIPNVVAVIILSKFCKSIDLQSECIQLLNTVLSNQQLSPHNKHLVQYSLEYLNS